MMVWLGGVMCKLTVAAFLPLQMAENHLNLPTQVQFFTLTSFISSSTSFISTSFTTAFGGISLWQICATTKGKSPLNSTLTTLHYRYIRGAPSPVFPHHHSSSSSSTGQMDGWTIGHSLFTFSRERLLTFKYFQGTLLHLFPLF